MDQTKLVDQAASGVHNENDAGPSPAANGAKDRLEDLRMVMAAGGDGVAVW